MAIVFVAGTISIMIPTITFAQVQNYKQEYKGYEDYYEKDYDKKKSSGINLSVKCNNININGAYNAGQMLGDLPNKMIDENDQKGQEDQWLGNSEKEELNGFNNTIICINAISKQQTDGKQDNDDDPIPVNLDLAVATSGDDSVSILFGNGDGTFGPVGLDSVYDAGSEPVAVAVGSFTSSDDNFLDLLIVDKNSDSVTLLPGFGDGSFVEGISTISPVGNQPSSVAVGLFNADNFLDVAVANSGSASVSILLGTGTQFLGPKTDFAVGNEPRSVAAGLFNSDNFLDLAIANNVDGDISILLGNGDGTFGPKTDFVVAPEPVSVAVGSFNSNADNFLDLAVVNFEDGVVSILLGNGDGTFVSTANDFNVGLEPEFVAVGLFNADLFPDLAVANSGSASVSILLGNGDGTFGTKTDFAVGLEPVSVAVGLFNADNFLDLAVANNANLVLEDGVVSILLGNGDGTFGPRNVYQVRGNAPASVAVGEFCTGETCIG